MDIITYTAEHNIFRESLRKFLDKEIVPHIEEWEEAGIVPRRIWKKMGEQGFLCTDVPEEYGGSGGDFLYSVIVCEELSKATFRDLPHPCIVIFASPIFQRLPQRNKSANICPAAFPEISLQR